MKIKHEIKLNPEEFLGFSKGFFLRFHSCMFKLQLCCGQCLDAVSIMLG